MKYLLLLLSINAYATGQGDEVKYPLDEYEYEACYQKLVHLDPAGDMAKALESCMSDMQCEQAATQCWDVY